jgi:hypothetical protein
VFEKVFTKMKKSLILTIGAISLWSSSLFVQVDGFTNSLASDIVTMTNGLKQSRSISKGTASGIKYEVRGTSNTSVQSVNGSTRIMSGRNVVNIRSGRISLNGKDRGKIKTGDSVLLDTSGILYVNGKKR